MIWGFAMEKNTSAVALDEIEQGLSPRRALTLDTLMLSILVQGAQGRGASLLSCPEPICSGYSRYVEWMYASFDGVV